MRNDLKTAIDDRLAAMDWSGQAEVLRRIRTPRKTVKLRTMVAVCAMLLLLCLTALAFTMQFSLQYDAVQKARGAISAKYGLTDEMLDLFGTSPRKEQDGWVVRFEPFSLNMEAMGVYTVICREDGFIQATWSHDNTQDSGLPPGDLGASAWGAKQLERAISLRRNSVKAWSEAALKGYEEMTLEERAALDAPLLANPGAASVIHIAPEDTDIPPEQAVTLARQAVASKYGVSQDVLEALRQEISFYLIEGVREYRVILTYPRTRQTLYGITIQSPSGKIPFCKWYAEDEDRTLPEGDLAKYVEAAREYAQSGAFELLSAAEKARVAERFSQAGLRVLLPAGEYVVPNGGDISESRALAAAKAALEDTFGFTKEDFPFFALRTAMMVKSGARDWQIIFFPKEQPNWRWRDFDKLGSYTVTIDAGSGRVIACDWSLAGVNQGKAYTRQTFGQAAAYSSDMLPWVRGLLAGLQAILNKYPKDVNSGQMSVEDDAAYDGLMREAGYGPAMYCYVTPEEGDISQDDATALALKALADVYGLDTGKLAACDITVQCMIDHHMGEKPVKVWCVSFFGYGQDGYTVLLDAATGQVEGIWHDSPASGNG